MHGNNLKKVVLVGATGLVGSRLLDMFLADVTVERVVVLTRRELDIQHKRLETILCDFTHPDQYAKQLRDFDILFCCIGTTMKNAGSRDAFLEVDYHIPMRLAAMASKAGIRKFIAISSLGADPASSNFYLRTKGEMERDIDANYKFTKLAFVRPSLLLGPRKEFRLGEKFGQFFMVLFSFAMIGRFRKYRPIHDFNVAKAMISVSNSVNNQRVYESLELEWLGR
ncbi:MAG: NAD(P)H-binding protein [Bacteroidia bacterium]